MKYAGMERKTSRWNTTSIYSREIKLKNGKRIFFDDNVYKNFKEIDGCILENIEKYKKLHKF